MSRPDLLGGFGPPQADRSAATRALKDLVRKACDLEPEAPVFVAEVACGEIDCPDTETVVAIYRGELRFEYRCATAIADVTGADLVKAANTSGGVTNGQRN